MPQNSVKVSYAEVTPDEAGQRLDNWLLARLRGVPRSHVYRIIRSGEVRVNKGRAKALQRLRAGDSVRIPPVRSEPRPPVATSQEQAARLNGAVLYRDHDLLVLNKPPGWAVHGGSGLNGGLIDAVRSLWGEDWQLAHRLDRDTSGCLLLCRRREVLRAFQQALAEDRVEKRYSAIVHGQWPRGLTRLDSPLARSGRIGGERRVQEDAGGKQAVTEVAVARQWPLACLLDLRIRTGRTHQIRVQTAAADHPVVGDDKYGRRALDAGLGLPRAPRLCLHARALRLEWAGSPIDAEAPPPPAFEAVLTALDKSCP